jgi:hypothetical protein
VYGRWFDWFASRADRAAALSQAAQLRDLVSLEPTCKWAKLTLAHTLARLKAAAGGVGGLADEAGRLGDEEAAHLAELADLDPLRKGYYASLLAAH